MTKKSVYGVGICEKGKHQARKSGKDSKSYKTWHGMLERCYSNACQEKHPTYIGCSVCDEWLEFQVFADWYEENYPKDGARYFIDKDLKVLGNKIYSPELCLMVSSVVNNFTIDSGAARGAYMIGVCFCKSRGNFLSQCRNPLTGKGQNLGYFKDELSAHLAWRKRKSELAYELAMIQDNTDVRDALLRWKDALDNEIIHPIQAKQ